LRNELGVELEERDYVKKPLTVRELKEMFKGRDPREFLNSKSPAFKAMGLRGKKLSAAEAVKLMAQEPNLIKRPLVITDRVLIAGFDRDQLREALS